MGLFSKKHYDRNRIMNDAQRAEKAGRAKKAAAFYQEVLAAEPNNAEIHRRLAPLLAQTGDSPGAWRSYKHTVEGLVRNKQLDQAVAVLSEAGGHIPQQAGVWATLASVELKRGRAVDARKALLDGRGFQRSRRQLPLAIGLLQRALQLCPDDFEIGFDLADSLARARDRKRARPLLQRLAEAAEDEQQLRRVRARQFRLAPTPAAAWRWFRTSPAPASGLQQPRAV